ncbi:3-dehydroquinate synthase [Candidatus Peregrinibacteria bacterium]|nr:MAG: 3-dehydroquinate synthase [Candidatus Peregrinibacteria bacterium]
MELKLETFIGNSEVIIKEGLLNNVSDHLNLKPDTKLVIVSDQNIEKSLGKMLAAGLKDHPRIHLTLPPGEASKNLSTIAELSKQMLMSGITKSDMVIGYGGGVITDLAGFLASIYMRGMKFVAIPTSLLAMVDAAIGGKTGVDLISKNAIGTTYLAEKVLIDPTLLESLPEDQKINGMGEVIKYGCIVDPSIFDDLNHPIEKCVRAKIEICSADVSESGRRKILNYGHTFGHAIEAESNYQIGHGLAIAIGMGISNQIAQKLNKQSPDVGNQIKRHLESAKLPTKLPEGMTIESLLKWIQNDKKRTGDSIDFIIVPQIGRAEIVKLSMSELKKLAGEINF